MAGRLPTETELLINEHIMGRCNHLEHTTETRNDGHIAWRYLICTKCKKELFDPVGTLKERTKKPKGYLKRFVRRYSEDIAVARTVVKHLADMGWKTYTHNKLGKFQYIFMYENIKVAGELADTEQAAICSAAEKLVLKNLLDRASRHFRNDDITDDGPTPQALDLSIVRPGIL